ncbi:DUF4157 domain-containing protein, partial [Moorena sp. SIO3B2]
RVHNDAQSDQLNQSIQARAFTTGKDIFFRQGEYNPGSRGGQELIAHELTHVVQQNQGKLRSTINFKSGININDDAGFEKEANLKGKEALQHPVSILNTPLTMFPISNYEKPVQRAPEEKDDQKKQLIDWIADIVKKQLETLNYRIGGSFAAKTEYGFERTPQDIDLEFWSYEDALKAKELLKAYEKTENEDESYPQLLYFLPLEEEAPVSVTMLAMGKRAKVENRGSLLTIELNNENYRQGAKDFKKLPNTRYEKQPPTMRRNSLIAGSLERYSYNLVLGKEDTKQDKKFLEHMIGSLTAEEKGKLFQEIMERFDWDMIKDPPIADQYDEEEELDESDEEEEVDHTQRMEIASKTLQKLIENSSK